MQKHINDYAVATISGSKNYPNLKGKVTFSQMGDSVMVTANIYGLPYNSGKCKQEILAFHLHEGNSCTGSADDPFADVKGHYNPSNCQHPYHAGDFPPLFSNNGIGYLSFLTNRFTVKEVIGRTVIIHKSPDDFTSQPSGNAGEKIACGVIGG